MLTGEAKTYRTDRGTFSRPTPTPEFRDDAGGLGAFEVGFRFSHVDLDDRPIAGGRLDNRSFAFDGYPANFTRVVSNITVADLADPEPVPIFQIRLQVAF